MVNPWLAISEVLMNGFASFAVDYGRVQIAKAQLHTAATATARAPVTQIDAAVSATQTTASTIASANYVDGDPVSLDINNDIEFGTWDDTGRTFTVLSGAARSGANAIRVTAQRLSSRGNPIHLNLAAVVGKSECDVKASATAKISSVSFPFVGTSWVTLSGQGNTDSFDSSLGAYSPSSATAKGTVATNGDVTISGSSIIKGDAHYGAGHSVLISGSGSVTGTKSALTATLAYSAPTVPSGAINSGAVSLGGGTYYVAPGDYYCSSMSVTNKATFYCQGPVRVFCSGPVNISGGYIHTYLNRPGNYQLYVTNNSSVTLNGQSDFYAQIYAPLSDVSQGGQADIYGSIIAKTLTFGGTWKGGAHADTSLTYLGTPVIVTTK